MPSLRALECLVAVADTGSITRAARLLHSSQPAVSHHLSALEIEAGTDLLRRDSRGVHLTPAGRAALAEARRAVDAAAAAMSLARAAGTYSGGTLRVACAQSLTVALLAPVIRYWHTHHPDVAIVLRESMSVDELIGLVDADLADLVLMPNPAPIPFTITPIADEEIVVATPTGHRFAEKPFVTLQDLEGAPLVHFAPENGLSVWLDQLLARAGVSPVVVMRTSVTTAAPQLAAAGLGIAVCPLSAIADGFPGAVLSLTPKLTRQLVAVTPAEPTPLVARFIHDLRSRGVQGPSGPLPGASHPEPPDVAP